MLSNAYFLAKIRFDTAENEPAKNLQNFAKFANFADPNPLERIAADSARAPAMDTGAQARIGELRRAIRNLPGPRAMFVLFYSKLERIFSKF